MSIIGRGRFSRVVEEGETAVKVVEVDDLVAPHNIQGEIAALKMLKHPNIIALLDTRETGRGPDREYQLVFPLYRYTLLNILYTHSKASFPPGSGWRNRLELSSIAQIGARLADALAHIHSHGIVHRDIKPENILFSTESSLEPILIDFGVSWVPGHGEEDPKITDVCSGVYKAPELVLGCDYNESIDIWSLGCVLARLAGPDTKDLFGDYNGDIALFGTQMAVLGAPDAAKCPTIASKASGWAPNEDQGAKWAQLRGLAPEIQKMLCWEPSQRPSAAQVRDMLSQARLD